MRQIRTVQILLIMLALTAVATTVAALDPQAVKQRMLERLPVIVELKEQGVVGENNRGFLEFMPGRQAREEVVRAENEDRRLIYAEIAGQEGTSVEKVGALRAQQIREKARPGEWLQAPNGKWYQK